MDSDILNMEDHPGCDVFNPPPLSSGELRCLTLDSDYIEELWEIWQNGSRIESYQSWFSDLCYKPESRRTKGQMLTWNKYDFALKNIFGRTVDTSRVLPFDRPWRAHIYYHKSVEEKKVSAAVAFTLPELMILRGMHDKGCDDIYIILTNMQRENMDDLTQFYKKYYSPYGSKSRRSAEREVFELYKGLFDRMQNEYRRPCLFQLDLTFRGLIKEKKPPFIIIYSTAEDSYSQIYFMHESFVPSKEVYFDLPGCPDPKCRYGDDCDLVRFPRDGLEKAIVLPVQWARGEMKEKEMCNWVECNVCFPSGTSAGSSRQTPVRRLQCSKCKQVAYCSAEHQKKDWDEHKRMCVKATGASDEQMIVSYVKMLSGRQQQPLFDGMEF